MTGFWIFMFIMCLLTPAVMIGFGKYFMKGGPKQINGVIGYRTHRSMKNQETWRFTHQYSGRIWHRSGLASTLYPFRICTVQITVVAADEALHSASSLGNCSLSLDWCFSPLLLRSIRFVVYSACR